MAKNINSRENTRGKTKFSHGKIKKQVGQRLLFAFKIERRVIVLRNGKSVFFPQDKGNVGSANESHFSAALEEVLHQSHNPFFLPLWTFLPYEPVAPVSLIALAVMLRTGSSPFDMGIRWLSHLLQQSPQHHD